MQNVRHIAQNAGHTVQNDGPTMKNVGRTTHYVSHNTLNVCQGPKGGLEVPPRAPGRPPTKVNMLADKMGEIFTKIGCLSLLHLVCV